MIAESIFWILLSVAAMQRMHVKFQRYHLRLRSNELLAEIYYQIAIEDLKEENN